MTGGGGMAQQQGSNDLLRQKKLDNARVGYQVATSLWIYEGGLIWSKFNTLLVANSIILAVISLTLSVPSGAAVLARVFSIAIPIMGIVLCVLWWLITRRSWEYHDIWLLSAREIEERFLSNEVNTVRCRRALVRRNAGEIVEVQPLGRPQRAARTRTAANLVICLFGLLYLILLIVSVGTLLQWW
jgi:hypothetical protein